MGMGASRQSLARSPNRAPFASPSAACYGSGAEMTCEAALAGGLGGPKRRRHLPRAAAARLDGERLLSIRDREDVEPSAVGQETGRVSAEICVFGIWVSFPAHPDLAGAVRVHPGREPAAARARVPDAAADEARERDVPVPGVRGGDSGADRAGGVGLPLPRRGEPTAPSPLPSPPLARGRGDLKGGPPMRTPSPRGRGLG